MSYRSVPEGMNFSTEFPTYIIAYCPDTNGIFVTNERFFWAEYDKEFQTEEEGINYVKSNANKILEWKNQFPRMFDDLKNWFEFMNLSDSNCYILYDAQTKSFKRNQKR